MTQAYIPNQGSTLKIDTSSTSTPSYILVNGFTDWSGIGGGSAAVIDTSDLSSPRKEKAMGLADEGQCSIDLIRIAKDAGQTAMMTARGTRASTKFQLNLSDGSKYEFSAYVLTFEVSGGGSDDVLKAKSTLEINGQAVFTATV